MGGTSTDVSLIVDGRPGRATARDVAGFPLRLPTVDLQTVGAGGGSIVWRDSGGALRVGPESAGADPGPACYGKGGTRPTITDANLLLGRLPRRLAGGIELDPAASERAFAGIDPAEAIEVVNAEMLRALRLVSVERGHDPRDFALVAFGGAGPCTGARWPRSSGCDTVLVPGAAGVLSALGLVASDERRDRVALVPVPARRGGGAARPQGEADLRYEGQSFELTVPLQEELGGAFHRAHEAATATPSPSGRSSSWPCGRPRCGAGPRFELPAAEPLEATRPGGRRARGRHLLASPGVGGG